MLMERDVFPRLDGLEAGSDFRRHFGRSLAVCHAVVFLGVHVRIAFSPRGSEAILPK
jgi:hypothetical protein